MKRLSVLLLLSAFCCSLMAENLKVKDKTYGIDREKKLIVVSIDLGSVKTENGWSGIDLDETYSFVDKVSVLTKGIPYLVKNESGEVYRLYLSEMPVITMTSDGTIVNTPAVHGVINVADQNGSVISMNMGIKIRGTSSQEFEKKSYRIELWADETGTANMDTTFLGLRSDDDWNLEAMYMQPLRLRDKVANDLWRTMYTLPYSIEQPDALPCIREEYADVFLNNLYIGIYTLTERIDRKQLQLKKYNVEVRGMLFKGNGDGAPSFETLPDYDNSLDTWDNYEWVYPNESDTLIDWEPLYSFVNFVINSTDETFLSQYATKFDLANAIDYYLFINMLKADNNMARNTFIARYKKTSEFFFIPWDLEAICGLDSYGNATTWTGELMTNGFYDRLILDCNDNGFVKQLQTRYAELRSSYFTTSYIMNMIQTEFDFLNGDGAYDRESEAWPEFVLDETQLSTISAWLDSRLNYLDITLNTNCGTWSSEEAETTPLFNVFPNPVTDMITVDINVDEEVLVRLYDLQGCLLYETCGAEGYVKLPAQGLSNGVYIVVVAGADWQQAQRIVVKR